MRRRILLKLQKRTYRRDQPRDEISRADGLARDRTQVFWNALHREGGWSGDWAQNDHGERGSLRRLGLRHKPLVVDVSETRGGLAPVLQYRLLLRVPRLDRAWRNNFGLVGHLALEFNADFIG